MTNLELFSQFATGKKDNTAKLKKAVVYTRVSTKEQADNNLSLDTQKKACLAFAQKHGYETMEYFGGTYESAKTDERKEFNKMLAYVKRRNEKIGYIIVYSVDRFSRSGANAIYIANELKKMGIAVLSVTQPTDTMTSSGALQQSIQFIFSQYDNDLRREKTMAGTKEKLLRGYWVTKPPMGYDMVRQGKEQKITINETGKLVRKAFIWKAEHGKSSAEITRLLKGMGLHIDERTISKMFRNPFYCGLLRHRALNGEVVPGKHPKIVSRAIFLKANDVLSKNSQAYKVSYTNDRLPMKQFLKCYDCRYSFAGYEVKKKGLFYYKCNHKDPRYACNRSAEKMHKMFEKTLRQFELDKKYVTPVKSQLVYTFESLTEQSEDITASLKAEVSAVKKKLEAIEERFALGLIDASLFEKFKEKYQGEITEVSIQINKLGINVSNLDEFVGYAIEMSRNLANTWVSGDYEVKRKLQYLVFPEGIFYDKANDIYRIEKVNEIFRSIALLSVSYDKAKIKGAEKISVTPPLAVRRGIEPLLPG